MPKEKFEQRAENVWVAKSASVAPTAYINGPCIIDEDAEIRHCAFIRGSAIVGAGAVVSEGKEFPENSLILGVPAKAVKKLSSEQIKMIQDNADNYVKLSKQYKED